MREFLKKNKLIATVIISFIVILIALLSSYIIYVYGFYDKLQDNKVLEYYNSYHFDDLYYYMDIKNDKYMNKKTFQGIVNTMYNKLTLQQIYNTYYINSDMYKDLDSFVNEFYYGYGEISKKDLDVSYKGKTDFFRRRKIIVKGAKVSSASEVTSYLGTIKNTSLIIDDGASIKIDDISVDCDNNTCNIEYMFGGIHQLEYTSGDFIFYSIYNFDKDNMIVNVPQLDNLISINRKVSIDASDFDKVSNGGTKDKVDVGLYSLASCTKKEGCPGLNSFMSLNMDGTLSYNRFYGNVVNKYVGTYTFNNGFINIVFNKVDDRVIEEKVTFKIGDDGSFGDEYYHFVKKA